MENHSKGLSEIYRRFLSGELSLEDAAQLLRKHAEAGPTKAGSLSPDTLPEHEREKA